MGAAYPAHLEADVVLRDGSTVHLRPVRAGDEAALLELFDVPRSRLADLSLLLGGDRPESDRAV